MDRLSPVGRRALLGLARALLDHRAARIRFRDAPRAVAERTIDVLALAWAGGGWTVAAWCPEQAALRLLDLDRIRSVRALRRPASPGPDAFDRDGFLLRPYLDPAAGPPREAQATLARRWRTVARALFPTSRLDPAGGGRLACRLRATRPEVVRAMAASLADPGAIDSGPAMPTRPTPRPSRRPMPLEARLIALVDFLAKQTEPVTRERILAQFPADYRGSAAAIEKKFTRDKDAIRDLGFLLQTVELGKKEEQVGYRIDARGSRLPAVEFASDEAAVVWAAGVDALRASDHPLRDELESALRKLSVGARGLAPRAAAAEALSPAARPEKAPAFLDQVVGAWRKHKRIRIAYLKVGDGSTTTRDVDVYGWASRRGEWIFVGHCHLRNALRIFYVSRVLSVAVNTKKVPGRPSKESDYDIPDTFDIRRWSRQQIWEYDVHAPRPATVRFRGSLAPLAKALLPGARVTTEETGARLARLEVTNLRGLARQALAWGPEAELLEPEDGRRMAREILDVLAAPAGGTP
jgi:proteasome accessory factor B